MTGYPISDAQREQRCRQWHHNSLLGAAAMIEKYALRIETSDTTTENAKRLAASIRQDAVALKRELKVRVD